MRNYLTEDSFKKRNRLYNLLTDTVKLHDAHYFYRDFTQADQFFTM